MSVATRNVYDWSARPPTLAPCGCEGLSLFSASVVGIGCQKKSHVPASRCRCGKHYWSWSAKKWFVTVKETP